MCFFVICDFIMNTEPHDFYVTLPSNTSTDTFPNNTPSEYTAKLSQRIELSGEWEVALHTISYVKWNTIKLNRESVHYVVSDATTSTKKTGSQLKDYYANVKEYIADMNASILEADKGKIVFAIQSGKVTITLESGYSVHLRKEQAIILGFLTFNDSDIVKKITATETGSYEANLHRETSIYVYCDIIEPQIVGNKAVPLLDIIWDKEKGKREITHSTENLHYVSVRTKSFEEVKVLLRSSTNERISFEHGHTSITLHFIRKDPNF